MVGISRISGAQRPFAVAAIFAAAAIAFGSTMLLSDADASQAGVTAASFSERFYAGTVAADCAGRNWPYIAAECLRTPDGSRARPVRMIAIDRQIPAK